VRVGYIGHVTSVDVQHDQEQPDHVQCPDQQRGEDPGVDFDGPIHNGITTYRPRSSAARPQLRQTSGEVGIAVVTDSDLAR